MPINVNNPEADALTRKFAGLAGVGITDAIVLAMKEAIARRFPEENALDTAARIRAKHGIRLDKRAQQPLSDDAYDSIWDDKSARSGD